MFIEHRRSIRPGDSRERAKVDNALAESKRLIAQIDVLLRHSHELIDKQTALRRFWR
jgi:hypothetical protein